MTITERAAAFEKFAKDLWSSCDLRIAISTSADAASVVEEAMRCERIAQVLRRRAAAEAEINAPDAVDIPEGCGAVADRDEPRQEETSPEIYFIYKAKATPNEYTCRVGYGNNYRHSLADMLRLFRVASTYVNRLQEDNVAIHKLSNDNHLGRGKMMAIEFSVRGRPSSRFVEVNNLDLVY